MRILIIGGTAFVGRHITEAALTAGHDVTLFHRGQTGPGLFPQVTHLIGDRDGDLSALASGAWDATIDVSAYLPRQVRSLAAALGDRGGHHVLISSVSAYQFPARPGFTEDWPLAGLDDPETEVIDDSTYGGLKAACEIAVTRSYGEANRTIVRPTYVIGPHDYSYRFTWWVERIARGGTVLAPGERSAPIQVIDARDMAAWIVSLASRAASGIFHAASPPPPFGFGDLLDAIAAQVAPAGTKLVWADPGFLLQQGCDEASLPLWPGADSSADLNAADPSAALAAGLRPRPLAQSIAEIHAAEMATPTVPRRPVGLTAEREADLLARWEDVHGQGG